MPFSLFLLQYAEIFLRIISTIMKIWAVYMNIEY